jgi:predicted ATPase
VTRVCDCCQPTVDGYLDLWVEARQQRDQAQGCAWKATDLLTRWMELFLEREHMTDVDYVTSLAQLMSESQGFLLTAPAYTLASSALNVATGPDREGEDPSGPVAA